MQIVSNGFSGKKKYNLSPLETICVKSQILFSGENKKHNLVCRLLTISYQKPFIVSVSVLSFRIFTAKFNSWPKTGLTYSISVVNWIFGIFFFIKKSILCFFTLVLNY